MTIDKETKREIMAVVNAAVRDAVKDLMLLYQEELVTEEELCKRIQMFTRSGMKDYGKFLPQASATYEDNNGRHETRTVYGLHAIQQMIANNDLDFTRPDRVVYRASKGRTKTRRLSDEHGTKKGTKGEKVKTNK
jgi:hypothetical protein